MPGNASAALIPNRPNSYAKALSLFLIHSFKPFSSLGGGSPPPDATAAPPGDNASTSTLMAIPIAVSMEAIIIPCSLNRVWIFSANEVSLSDTFAIVSLKLVIWFFSLPLRILIDSCLTFKSSFRSSILLGDVFFHCIIVFSRIFSEFLKLSTLFCDVFFQLKLSCHLNS